MTKRIRFVGMDVHQHSIDLTVAESGHDGAVTHFASIGGDPAALDGAVAPLRQRGAELFFVYEAGPCGYGIYRHLRQAGLACAVVAPAQVPKKAADRVKTDRRDARTLAVQQRAGALRPITVPDEDDEAMRDLVRAREDAVHSRRRARQRVNSFLLRHGRAYPCGKKNWGARHRRWLAEQHLPRARSTSAPPMRGMRASPDSPRSSPPCSRRGAGGPWSTRCKRCGGCRSSWRGPWWPRAAISPASPRAP